MMKAHVMRQRILALTLVAPLCLFLLSCQTTPSPPTEVPAIGTPEASANRTLRIGQTTWPDTIAPQKASYPNEVAPLMLNYEGLTRFDEQLNTIPGAAESWSYSSDAQVVTFTLRSGLMYSDKTPLVAKDFLQAIRRTLDPHTPGDYQNALDMIVGAKEIIGTAVPTDEGQLESRYAALGVTMPDDRTLVFRFVRPTPFFHTLAALWLMFPAKQELVDKGGEQWYEDPSNQIGNGPFQVTQIDRSTGRIHFEANPQYWGPDPVVHAVDLVYVPDRSTMLQAYQKGELDIIAPDPNDVPSIKTDSTLQGDYTEYPGACTTVLSFNLTRAPFDNLHVRRAFAYGFDRVGYARDALLATEKPTLTWIAPGYPGYDATDQQYPFDLDKAKAELVAAGYPDGKGMPELMFMYDSSNPSERPRAEYLASMYQKNLGITLKLDPIDGTTLANFNKSNSTYPQIAFGTWCADYPDPQNWLSVFWASSSNFAQNMGYANPEVDRLLAQADTALDPTERKKLYAEAQRLVIADAPKIMRSNSLSMFLIKPTVPKLALSAQDWQFPGQVTGLMPPVPK